MIWFVVVFTMTIESRIHLDEIPTDTYPSLWLDTDMLDAEWRDRYSTEPPTCWRVMMGQKPQPCDTLKLPDKPNAYRGNSSISALTISIEVASTSEEACGPTLERIG